MMRSVVAVVLAVAVVAQLALAAAAADKSICTPIKINTSTIDPSRIPSSQISGMSDRGRGSYTFTFNLCSAGSLNGCTAQGFVGISNASGCVITFDKAMSRPTPTKDGFRVVYAAPSRVDDIEVEVKCSYDAGAALMSKSKKFATTFPNKRNGTTVQVLVFSSVACAAGPAPPSPGNASCRTVTILGQAVDPRKWAASFLTLDTGFTTQWSFLFDVCSSNPKPPSWGTPCSKMGYITKYNGGTCLNQTFDSFLSFDASRDRINTRYGSSTNPKDEAHVEVGCLQGAPYLTSPTGTYKKTNNTMGGTTYVFALGIQDMCGGATLPPPPPVPPQPTGSGSHLPPSGSGSQGPMPSSGSSQMPPVPSGNSGSQSNMPSGGSQSSNMPSGGSQSSGMPSM